MLPLYLFPNGDQCMILGWSKEELMQAWLGNPEAVCEEVGVERPLEGNHDSLRVSQVGVAGGGAECGICCLTCDHNVEVACGHHFCKSCWKE